MSRGEKEMQFRDFNYGNKVFDEWCLFLPKYRRIISNLYNDAKKNYSSTHVENQEIPTLQNLSQLNISKNVMKKFKLRDNL